MFHVKHRNDGEKNVSRETSVYCGCCGEGCGVVNVDIRCYVSRETIVLVVG